MIITYNNGLEFLENNNELINTYGDRLQFFYTNAKNNLNTEKNFDCLFGKVNEYNRELLFCLVAPYSLLLFGIEYSTGMINHLVDYLISHNIKIKGIRATEDIALKFIDIYEKKSDVIFVSHSKRDLYTLRDLNLCTTFDTDFRLAVDTDEDLLPMFLDYFKKINYKISEDDCQDLIHSYIENNSLYVLTNAFGIIVSMVSTSRTIPDGFSINHLYTKKNYRNKNYAKAIISELADAKFQKGVKYITALINNDFPYIDGLFKNIGFLQVTSEFEYDLTEKKETAIFAGGCFWCIAKPYNEYDGVLRVLSGYTGGKTKNPTYKDVKSQTSGHKEAIKIDFDPNIISYQQLLDIYFYSIDPFDGDGQFIDRGSSYQTAIYYTTDEQKELAANKISELENTTNKKVHVMLEKDSTFYPAEAYHQDYSIKNPQNYSLEFLASGRIHNYYEFFVETPIGNIKFLCDKDEIIEAQIIDQITCSNPKCCASLIDKIKRYFKAHPKATFADLKQYIDL